MLRDTSIDSSTETFGAHAMPFGDGRHRLLVVACGFNSSFRMGSRRRGAVEFEMVWHDYVEEAMARVIANKPRERIKEHGGGLRSPWPDPSGRARAIRYVKIKQLGAGSFGHVFKAINVDTGQLMAIKQLKASTQVTGRPMVLNDEHYQSFQRECQALEQLRHKHIVKYLGSQGLGGPQARLFMGLNDGDLRSLILVHKTKPKNIYQIFACTDSPGEVLTSTTISICSSSRSVEHSLYFEKFHSSFPKSTSPSWLDHLACKGVIHRDLTPSNIFYKLRPDGLILFQITDFGLVGSVGSARNVWGTLSYTAPETVAGKPQTCKVDIWAFFVTLMWVLDVNGFREQEVQVKWAEEAQRLVALGYMSPLLTRV
ncbi:serine/threonine protein kinase [Coccidioides immitis RS]|uniref:EKC/KEOPS complex subunit BUD32 n=2 Tax=Coccidioides immitis TaxID=5501 RepID=J3KLB6_COCIM|nr:serine/threonine protein kinase [Coccidioides immitis RS]EAS37056.3 serine/threonine protein kinase [Coccidioides immitis RS]KMP09990.1 hypothetical protein CIRG_09222 [Coccidioides immitis RMSCC 2394]